MANLGFDRALPEQQTSTLNLVGRQAEVSVTKLRGTESRLIVLESSGDRSCGCTSGQGSFGDETLPRLAGRACTRAGRQSSNRNTPQRCRPTAGGASPRE